jgi:hypothetical protein
MSVTEIVESYREQLLDWYAQGKSYFWMAMQIGLSDRSASAISVWFRKQGIFRKVKNE